jgi:hypothetical protein
MFGAMEKLCGSFQAASPNQSKYRFNLFIEGAMEKNHTSVFAFMD